MTDENGIVDTGSLMSDIEAFRQKFKTGSIWDNPYKHALHSRFGDKDVDRLNLIELCCLGFNSNHITREDFKD